MASFFGVEHHICASRGVAGGFVPASRLQALRQHVTSVAGLALVTTRVLLCDAWHRLRAAAAADAHSEVFLMQVGVTAHCTSIVLSCADSALCFR
jgi:hypothetical protein